jgi:hypothetical protein
MRTRRELGELAGDVPTIDLVVGHSKTNESPVLKVFLSRVQELIGLASSPTQSRFLIAR